MNTPNNIRRRKSRKAMERVFIQMLQTRNLNQITVSDICKAAGLNRTTFYSNYEDVYALADSLREKLEAEVAQLFDPQGSSKYTENDWLRLFQHIRDNQLFYITYFKLGYDHTHDVDISALSAVYPEFPKDSMEYHVAFFKAGFNAIVKKWLAGGCKETPEQISEILKSEYRGRRT